MTEIILHLSAGQGPEECRWVVGRLARAFTREAVAAGLEPELLEPSSDSPASLLLRIAGTCTDLFAQAREGSILWVGASPFRPHHKRRNWFVGVSRVPPVDEIAELREEDIAYQATRASGPGGQHVNKTDSAVRATHIPTGLVTLAQDQRSQHANRKLARIKLAMMLIERRDAGVRDARKDEWDRNHRLERGNPVRIYAGPEFRLKRLA